MPRKMSDEMRTRMSKVIRYMATEAPCTTIARVADKLNITWSQARNALYHLADEKIVLRVYISRMSIWCIDEQAAANAIIEIRRTLWRLICESKHRFVRPSTALELIYSDKEARKIFSKYIDLNRPHAHTIHFIAAALEDLLGAPIEKRQRRLLFYVPATFCKKDPTDINISRYISEYTLVSIKVTPTMYNDIKATAAKLGVTIKDIVNMAIERMLSRYRHILEE